MSRIEFKLSAYSYFNPPANWRGCAPLWWAFGISSFVLVHSVLAAPAILQPATTISNNWIVNGASDAAQAIARNATQPAYVDNSSYLYGPNGLPGDSVAQIRYATRSLGQGSAAWQSGLSRVCFYGYVAGGSTLTVSITSHAMLLNRADFVDFHDWGWYSLSIKVPN